MQLDHSLIRSHQRTINHLQQQVREFHQQNDTLKQQLQHMTEQRNRYFALFHKDPLSKIFANDDNLDIYDHTQTLASYEQQEKQLTEYHDRLHTYERKFLMQENRIREKEQTIKQQERNLLLAGENELDQRRINILLEEQLKIMQQTNTDLTRMIDQNQQNMTNVMQRYESTQRQLFAKRQEDETFIRELQHKLNSLIGGRQILDKIITGHQQVEGSAQRVKEMMERFRQQGQIMEEMGRELDVRNEQLAKLLSIQTQSAPSYRSDQHTIAEMVKSTELREQRYTELLVKYKEMLETVQTAYKEKVHLQRQYMQLKHQYESIKNLKEENTTLKQQYEKYKTLYQLVRQQLKQSDENTIAILEENQAFHELMFEKFGPKLYIHKIEEEVKKYEERKMQRENTEMWANVTELVNVNRKLRERVQRAK